MDAIVITLNGTPVSGRAGMTILDLAREVGVKIPTLCHDPSLKPVGACRICLVEEEKSGRFLASCVTPIAPGMVINTESPAVIENRKVIVKLILASHPESCILCDKGNRCQLRSIAADLGIGAIDYYPMPHFTGTQEANSFIVRDLSKCILCGKCIRADQELVVVGALEYMHRGFDATPATIFNGPLESSECTFCGTCVSVCPTGALSERGKPHLGTIGTRTPSVCSYCGCGCNIFLEAQAGRVVSVSPNPGNEVNGRALCVKGRYGSDYIHHPDRLHKPMIRKDGALVEVSWDEALDFVAEGLKRCRAEHGPDGVAFFGSSKCTNEDNYLFQKTARAVFGTNNIDNGARLHSGPALEVLPFGTMTAVFRDIEEADVILVVGSNPSASHPVAGYRIKRAAHLNAAKLIVIDPRKIDLVAFSAAWLPISAGTDSVLLNGVLKALLDSQASSSDSGDEQAEDLEQLKDSLAPFGRQEVQERTGCSSSLFDSILRLLEGAKSPAIVYGHGITRQAGAVESIRALANLSMLMGASAKRSVGIYPLNKENNGQGAWDMGSMPDYLPGYQALDDPDGIRRFEEKWQRPIPSRQGMRAMEMFQGAETGRIRSMYILGENPLRSFPDPSRIERALAGLDFLVVQDMFLTETANLAHAVLPASSFAEREGTFTNIEGRVQSIRRALEPLGQSRPDWEILCRLSKRLGYPMEYASAEAVMVEIASLVPLYGGISAAGLERGGVFRLVTAGRALDKRLFFEDRGGSPVLPISAPVPSGNIDGDDAFILLRGSSLFHFLGGTRSTRSPRLRTAVTPGFVEMNPVDARALDLKEGDSVRIHNEKAEISALLRISQSLPRGMLWGSCFDQSLSALFSFSSDSSDSPGIASCRARIEKEN